MDDNALIEFYEEHRALNTEVFQKWRHEEQLKKTPLFEEEVRSFVQFYRPELLKQLKKKIVNPLNTKAGMG